jgi:hypothetical protein
MTDRDTRRRFPATGDGPATNGGPATPALADRPGEGGGDVDDGHAYPTAEDVVQVTVTPR